MSRTSSVRAVARERRTSSSEPIFELVDLTAGYGDLEAIRSVSLELHPGEMVALFGPNGAGKTTTLMASIDRKSVV